MTATLMIPVDSHLLGMLEAKPEDVYTFAHGLYGFGAYRTFVLAPAGRPGLAWLQSVEDAALVFLLADPEHFFPRVPLDIPDAQGDARFVIVTLGEGTDGATANLQAPVVLDPGSRTGRQVVLSGGASGDAVRTPIAIA